MKLAEVFVDGIESVQLVFNALHWIGVGVASIGVLGVGLALSGRQGRLTRSRIVLLLLVPGLSAAAWIGDPRVVELLGTRFGVPHSVLSVFALVDSQWNWFEWVSLAFHWGVVTIGSVLLIETALERPKLDPSRYLLGIMVAVPWAINLLNEFDLIALEFDPTVFGFVVTGVAGIAVIDRFRLFDVPFARSQIVEEDATPLLVYGPDYRLFDYNQRAADLLDIHPGDLDQDVRGLLAERLNPVSDHGLSDGIDPVEALDDLVVWIDDEPGIDAYYLVDAGPLNEQADAERTYTVKLTDITELYRQQQRVRRERDRLDQFVGIVSHDLRNPLNVATGRLRLAREEFDSEHLDDIAHALYRMDALIEDLLSFARAGAEASEREPVSLARVTERCWKNVPTADATLTTAGDRRIRADESRLQQLLGNLFRNAVEHGGEDVIITVGALKDGFYVEDDGPGIPEDQWEEVFDAGYSTIEDGTGFGLAIVNEIADAHGWDVRVTESSDGGARFEITGVELPAE